MPVLNRRHVAIVVTLSILGVASAAISTARAHGASTATSVPLIWTPAKAELALTAALNIHAKDSSGAGIYDFRVQTIRQFKPVNVYFRGKIYKRGAFVVIVDAVPVHGNFQYGTLTSFCFRPASGVLPYHWVITGFDTLQTAINGAPPYGCRTTPEAMRAAGVRTR